MSGVVAGETQKTHTGIPVLHAGSHFRHGLLQLMIHTIDPMHDGKQSADFQKKQGRGQRLEGWNCSITASWTKIDLILI